MSYNRPSHLAHAAAAALMLAAAVPVAAVAQARTIHFNIPAQSLGSALRAYGQASGQPIIFSEDAVRGKASPGLVGDASAEAGLARLLEGSGLSVSRAAGGVVYLVRETAEAAAPAPLAEAPATVGELVVTAQRRAERLQDVPVAISAFTQATLDRQHIAGVRDLARVTPSLSFTEPSPGQAIISLRGLTTESSLSPVVGYYYDETPFELRSDIYAGMPMLELFDVQRVEVLRGPQGTLFGAGAMGGAIRIITNKPDTNAVSGQFEQEASFTDGGQPSWLARGAFNQPLSENLAVRVVGSYRRSGGYIDGAVPTDYFARAGSPAIAGRNENSADSYSGKITLKWDAAPGLTVTPSFIYQQIDANGLNYYDSATDNRVNYRLFPGQFTDKLSIANLLIQKDFGFADFISSTSYLHKTGDALTDYSSTAANLFRAFTGQTTGQPVFPTDNLRPTAYSQTTQEFRLTSKAGGWLRWTLGGYYDYTYETSAQLVSSPTLGGFISSIFGVSPPNATLIDFRGWNSDNQIAGFGEATVTPFKGLEITGGVRAYQLKQAVYQDVEGLLGDGPTPVARSTANGLNPKFVISYRPNRELNLYATAAKGFRAGGPNGVLIGAGCSLTNVYRNVYDPDGVWNYEAGVKSQALGGRVSANLAAYRIDWNDIQGEVDSNCGSFEANIGTARINGVEAELTVLPTDGLTLSGSFSYNDAKLRSLKPGFASGVVVAPGDRIINVPKVQYSFSGEYVLPTEGTWQPYVGVNFQHVGGTPTSYTLKSAAYQRPAYDNLDLNVGVRSGRFDASVFAHNLTNEVQIVDIVSSSVGQALYNPGRPLTVGVNLKERF